MILTSRLQGAQGQQRMRRANNINISQGGQDQALEQTEFYRLLWAASSLSMSMSMPTTSSSSTDDEDELTVVLAAAEIETAATIATTATKTFIVTLADKDTTPPSKRCAALAEEIGGTVDHVYY